MQLFAGLPYSHLFGESVSRCGHIETAFLNILTYQTVGAANRRNPTRTKYFVVVPRTQQTNKLKILSPLIGANLVS